MQGIFSNANDINLFLMIFPRISLHYKIVPVQFPEYGAKKAYYLIMD